ncbi:MAG: carbohydrate ABC transporter permease [Armatimonadota bacterium]|nr:carbohydrate ABC transporter permease [Armatimonadota bacterium]MDR7402313.1 carbohydrate ABC transporter permease [Armatimonadota bacterium]MDR7404380.1 carbohydrate ABC transporter permease [Armatimonadota bacterium]MDR7437298.1 carbohydrate ABC transporter permease [Armatimonadota bacterium]MDR7472637.1 carbohydrate ABC transporter permease [Armatimonadota bacterium]
MPLLPPRWRLLVAALALLSLPIVAGVLWLLLTGWFDRVHGLLPVGGWSPGNWRFLWQPVGGRPPLRVPLVNSLVFAVVVAGLEVVVASLAAYAISRMSFPGRRAFLGLVLVLHAFPAVSLLIAIFYILRLLGLFDTLVGVILVKVALELPLGIWLMKGFFDYLSWEIEMAALVDGMSRWGVFWRIALPLVRPGLLALGTFALLSAWGEFILPFTLIVSSQRWTMAMYMQSFLSEAFTDFGMMAAVGLTYAAPVLVLFVLGQRYLLSIYAGGVKG